MSFETDHFKRMVHDASQRGDWNYLKNISTLRRANLARKPDSNNEVEGQGGFVAALLRRDKNSGWRVLPNYQAFAEPRTSIP